jgi:outer membrane lipoprotein-sorting protein
MTRTSLLAGCALALSAAAASAAAPANLSIEQILDKNIAARGGLAAWRGVKTVTIEGQLDAGGTTNHQLPYVLKQKRPHKSRLEITFKDQTSLQVYDGSHGWKVRPFLNRIEVEDYTPAEAKIAAAAGELDGPLVDYVAKGTQVTLAGTEAVEGHPAYKLMLKSREGEKRALWIDAGTFLEVKMEGEPRKLDAKPHNVAIYFRDYKNEHGLVVPHLQETVVEGTKQSQPYRMTVTKFSVNEPLDDALFQKPQAAMSAAPGAKKP